MMQTPTTLAMMQARAKHKYITRREIAKLDISIEYEDGEFEYISSHYLHEELKKDIEAIKKPITIHYTAMPTA